MLPTRITALLDRFVLAKELSCGRNHCALLSERGEVWTWGRNYGGCLGRPKGLIARGLDEEPADFEPGKLEGLAGKWGRGRAVSVACSRAATAVVTAPWDGITEEEYLAEEERKRQLKLAELERIRLEKEELARQREKVSIQITRVPSSGFDLYVPRGSQGPKISQK